MNYITLKKNIVLFSIINLFFLFSLTTCLLWGFKSWQFSLFITILMFAYHIDIRLIIGGCVSLFKNYRNINSKKLEISTKEYNFLCKLNVKNWKGKVITWDKRLFEIKNFHDKKNIEFLLKNNINAEIVHWISFFVGFFSIAIGCCLSKQEWWLYLLTAIIASFVVDLPPILIQRYNRYRLLKIYKNIIKN